VVPRSAFVRFSLTVLLLRLMLAPRHRFSALVFVTGFLFLCARVFSGRSWVRKPRSPARFALRPWYLLEVDARWSSPVWAPGKISVDEASLIPHAGARRFSLSQFLPVFVSSCLCLGLFFYSVRAPRSFLVQAATALLG
jgi:hypothetical protein